MGASFAALITLAITSAPRRLPPEPQITRAPVVSQARVRFQRARFFEDEIQPLIAELDTANRAAAQRCLQRMERTIEGYHEGVRPFVRDLTSLSTRLGIIKRMPASWWTQDGRVENYVQEKFAQHLFSEEDLATDLSASLIEFRSDVIANQNRMLSRVRAALSTADLPTVQLEQGDEFFRDLSEKLGQYAAGSGTTSVENMMGAFVLGEVGAFAARSVVAGLLARFAPSVAISSAAGASATVGATATGAGGGSFGGPIGTVVGFGAGLAVGLVIDWWMTERFETELSLQMHTYLADLERALLDGRGGVDPERGGQQVGSVRSGENGRTEDSRREDTGLRDALPRLCDQLQFAYRDRFFEKIVLGVPE